MTGRERTRKSRGDRMRAERVSSSSSSVGGRRRRLGRSSLLQVSGALAHESYGLVSPRELSEGARESHFGCLRPLREGRQLRGAFEQCRAGLPMKAKRARRRPWIADGRAGLSAPTSLMLASPVKKTKSLYISSVVFLSSFPVFRLCVIPPRRLVCWGRPARGPEARGPEKS